MRIVGDVTVSLPYTLDFCAKGPDVEPIEVSLNDINITVFFPPSMSDGTIGQSFFASGWAWWTGTTLRLTLVQPITGDEIDVEEVRHNITLSANEVLRRLINSYRLRMHRPNIYPVQIDPKQLSLVLEYENGDRDSLPEPEQAFFYRSIPKDAPLEKSVNSTTIPQLLSDIQSPEPPSEIALLLLDAEWLEEQGEVDRAKTIREFVGKTTEN